MERTPPDYLVVSYLALRRVIGWLGIALPVVLALGAPALREGGLQDSISAYVHTPMRGVFVGTLSVIGVFLLSYRGYGRMDDRLGAIAGVAGVLVALFPTDDGLTNPSTAQKVIGGLHFAFAAIFLISLACFSLFLFTKTHAVTPEHPDLRPTRRKLARNRVYRASGGVMLSALALIVITMTVPAVAGRLAGLHPVFWLEALAVEAFGFSWLTKGEAILRDETDAGPADRRRGVSGSGRRSPRWPRRPPRAPGPPPRRGGAR